MTANKPTRPDASHRLAVYGSLAPGRPNHHILADIKGTWTPATVRGRLINYGWGDAMGYPALIPDPNAPEIMVQVLTSPDLPTHWPRLDQFEGPQYKRITLPVRLDSADQVSANIYIANSE